MKIIKKLKILFFIILILSASACLTVFSINYYVKASVKDRILSADDVSKLKDIDCILILGAGINDENTPSAMLKERLDTGITLYNDNVSDRLLMSGDHGQIEYDEVKVMRNYALKEGIAEDDIFSDHAGFSTYESMYRARDIFKADKVIIVTQKYHMYRALYIAEKLGIDAYGVTADKRVYFGQEYRELREILARNKDFLKCIVKPKPTFLGEPIPINSENNPTE